MQTRQAIIDAAMALFARKGFDGTTLKDISHDVGADAALVSRYFGSKKNLFRECLIRSMDADAFLSSRREDFGRTIVGLLLKDVTSVSMMLYATSDAGARAIIVDVLHAHVLDHLAQWIGGEEAEARAARVTVICSGLTIYLQQIPLQVWEKGLDDATRDWAVRIIQDIIDQ